MTKHTPGPIEVRTHGTSPALYAASVGQGYYGIIGTATQRDAHPTHGGAVSRATAIANATLWAASGELLAACEMLCRAYDTPSGDFDGDTADRAYSMARDAIASVRKVTP